MPKLVGKIEQYQALYWFGAVVAGLIAFAINVTWDVSSKNQLLESTKQQIEKVEAVAGVAASTAQTAASTAQAAAIQVTHLQASVAKADDKLDQIIEQQGNTTGKLDILIQMQTRRINAEAKAANPEPQPSYESRFVEGPRVYTR